MLKEETVRIVGHVPKRIREDFNAIAKLNGTTTAKLIAQLVTEKVQLSKQALKS